MSFDTMLNHKCDIYHMRRKDTSPGYGLPSSPTFSYEDTPDLSEITCHFGIKSETIAIVQKEPQTNYEAKIKLTLPIGTDIRLNDKVINTETGYEYTAGMSRNIRDHHIIVYLRRQSQQEPL